jgi:hypothetical protein
MAGHPGCSWFSRRKEQVVTSKPIQIGISKSWIPLLALTCCAAIPALENERFICVADSVTGFNFDDVTDEWDSAAFLPGERFLISGTGADSYKLEKLDDFRSWTASCRLRDDLDEHSYSCESGTNAVHFNRKELRFAAFRYFGYWSGSNDSVSISIGGCNAT